MGCTKELLPKENKMSAETSKMADIYIKAVSRFTHPTKPSYLEFCQCVLFDCAVSMCFEN